MNIKETNKITSELKKLNFCNFKEDGDILHFAELPYSGKKVFRDDDKNLLRMNFA